MLKNDNARLLIMMSTAISLGGFAVGDANAQNVDTDYKGHQIVSPSEYPKQPQLNQELHKRSKLGDVRDTSAGTVSNPGIPQLPPSVLTSPERPRSEQTPFSSDSQAGRAGTYGKPLGQTPDGIIIPPGIPEDTRIGQLRDVSNVQKGAVAFLLGFNLLMCLAWLFAAGNGLAKMDKFFHGDPFGTGRVDPTAPAANPVTGHPAKAR